MDVQISPITSKDATDIIDIFNYYVINSFAAYAENEFPYEAFDMLLSQSSGYPTATARSQHHDVIGFGLLRFYNPLPSFNRTAEITLFVHHRHTGKGVGKKLLTFLEKEGVKMGIKTILANISSLNCESLHFHEKNGFKTCGRFEKVCRKNKKIIDVIWMQKDLSLSPYNK